jgi:uncharacterized membrane protein
MARPAAFEGPKAPAPSARGPGGGWSDQEVALALGRLLQAGVFLAASVVLLGGLRYLVKYGATHRGYGIFTGEPADLSHVGGILRAAWELRGRGLIQLGLLLLIATPVARVAFSLLAFLRQRDRTYTVVTAFVLLLLLASLAGLAP